MRRQLQHKSVWCLGDSRELVRITIAGEGEQKAPSHYLTTNNVWWPIGIYTSAAVKQVNRDLGLVDNDNWLPSAVQVDDITFAKAVRHHILS